MKANKTMKAISSLFLLPVILISLSCEQPFRAGLGAVVDIRPPTVGMTTPGAGDPIYGRRTFKGFVEDDYMVDRVELRVTNHPDVGEFRNWRATNLVKTAQNKGDWTVSVDTTRFPDGDLKIMIRAFDTVREEAVEAGEYVFQVRNKLPKINLTLPRIIEDEGGGEGDIKPSANLNFRNIDGDLPSAISFPDSRQMQPRGAITGTILYDQGIYTGEEVKVNGVSTRYPPQIRIWAITDTPDPSAVDDPPKNSYKQYALGEWPTEQEVKWQRIEQLFPNGTVGFGFRWLVPRTAGFYGFEIRAQSDEGRVSFRYPRDFWPEIEAGGNDWDNPKTGVGSSIQFLVENRYVLIYVNTEEEPTRVQFLDLEDIHNEGSYSTTTKKYGNISVGENHPYVNAPRVNKNNKFIVRAKAWHARGITGALAFWESVTGGEKGVFVWDPADALPAGSTYPGWQNSYNVPITSDFGSWGFLEPKESSTRNFIFTYDPLNIRLGANIDNPLKGKSKVWKYSGTGDWEAEKDRLLDGSSFLISSAGLANPDWKEYTRVVNGVTLYTLGEDNYDVSIYAISGSGAPRKTDSARSVRLDSTPPAVELGPMEHEYIQKAEPAPSSIVDEEAWVVNGVIQIMARINDTGDSVSGLRTATAASSGDYFKDNSILRTERMYMLVSSDVDVDNVIRAYELEHGKNSYFPPVPTTPSGTLNIGAGITVYRHGPIFSTNFKFKTSAMYSPVEAGGLADGTYWLYMFARDNAFNVGHNPAQKIVVKASTDVPEIRLRGNLVDIGGPNISDDTANTGFISGGVKRNQLGAKATVSLQLRDDDGVDLGVVDGAVSGVTIKITGAQQTSTGVSLRTGSFVRSLDDAQVKAVFLPPSARERNGEISQAALVAALEGYSGYDYLWVEKGRGGDSLPDGIYQIEVTAKDVETKHALTGDPAATIANGAVKTSPAKKIWVFVDTAPPVINITNGEPNNNQPPKWVTPGPITGGTGISIAGTITERNGPTTLSATVTNSAGNPVSGASITPGNITNAWISTNTNEYNTNFTVPLIIGSSVSDNLRVTLTATDRFGNASTFVQNYRVDTAPPNVALKEEMSVFERRNEFAAQANEPNGGRLPGSYPRPTPPTDKFTRLANGVVRFSISAQDDLSKIDEVRYWLLPSTVAFTGWGHSTATATTAPAGKHQAFASGADFTVPVYVNTALLSNNTEYNLYVMARDEANNTTASGSALLQTIYVAQEEDKPFFGANPLSGIVGSTGMIVNMTINDDDGFLNPSNTAQMRPGTVKMWLTDSGSGVDYRADLTNPMGSGHGWIGPVTTFASGVTLTNQQNVSLSVNLPNVPEFTNRLTTVNGRIHYIIEVEDSLYGKFAQDGGTPATQSWRAYYNFELDTTPPTISITAPADGAVFKGANTPDPVFTVTGNMSDTYLRLDDNKFILGIRLDGTSLFLTPSSGVGKAPFKLSSPLPPATTVNFTIPSADIFNANTVTWASLADGEHRLVFTAEDQSGQTTNSPSRSFIKDTTGPTFAFTRGFNDNKVELPQINNGLWWTKIASMASWTSADRDSYRAGAENLKAVTHDGTSAPSISGTFTDALSNINRSTVKFGWDGAAATIAVPLAQLGDDGKNVSWTIYLTTNGQPSTNPNDFLTDGVHSITLTVNDAVGNVLQKGDPAKTADTGMYGFRVVSDTPTATLASKPADPAIYGDRTGRAAADTVFTIGGNGKSGNLDDVRVKIRFTDSNAYTPYERSVKLSPLDSVITQNDWTFASTGTVPKVVITETLAWTYVVPRSAILAAGGNPTNNLMRPGNYEVTVIAVDKGGKKSEETSANTWTFVVDSTSPTFSFNLQTATGETGVNNADRGPTYWITDTNTRNRRNVISSDEPSINGRVSDSNVVDAVEVQFARWNYASAAANKWEIYNFSTNVFVPAATAVPGNTDYWRPQTMPSPRSSQHTLAWAFDGVANTWKDATATAGVFIIKEGYYSVRVRARDSSRIGSATLDWAAANGGNPVESQFVYFFIDRNTPVVDKPAADPEPPVVYSSRYIAASSATTPNTPQYGLKFRISATDANMFEKMEASVERINTADGTITIPAITGAKRDGTGAWEFDAYIPFTPWVQIPATGGLPATGSTSNGVPDGAYRIVFTATDLAGKIGKYTRSITLDNASPTARITEPRFVDGISGHSFASEIKIGGESFAIAGETDDQGINGSPSGPAGIWYRIGYGAQAKNSLPTLTSGMTAAQRSAAIAAWAVTTSGLTGVTADTGAAFNKNFDNASKAGTAGSLWFKYEQTGVAKTETYADGTTSNNTYDVPAGFSSITAAVDPYRWSMTAGSSVASALPAGYAVSGATLGRTTTYNTGSGPYLARQILDSTLPEDEQGKGLYSLPLVIRVVDNAGNVFYELRDIWLYPNGDNPSARYLNPSARFTGYNGTNGTPRGGQFSIDGVATDNVRIRNVIYRVKVDGTTNTTANPGIAPLDTAAGANGTTNIVTIPGATAVVWTTNGVDAGINTVWDSHPPTEATGTGTLSKNGWYKLTPTEIDTTMSWNFMLNAQNEISNLITAKGFAYQSASNNLIRVWIEMFAFDGNAATGDYNLISLGDSTDATKPRPYVREFYLTSSAPSVTARMISAQGGSTTPTINYGQDAVPQVPPTAGNYIRSGNFAVRATLNGNSSNISQIHVRLPGESNSDWRPVFVSGTTTAQSGVTITWPTANRAATLTYVFDSTAAASTTGAQSILGGDWKNSGGTLKVDVRVRDSNSPAAEAVYTFEVGVDNFAPVADTLSYMTPTKVAGSNMNFLGRVFDYEGATDNPTPEHATISEIRVWFTDRGGTNYYRMDQRTTGSAAQAGASAISGIYASPPATITYNGTKDIRDVTSVVRGAIPTNNPNRNVPTTAGYFKVITSSAGGTFSEKDSRKMDIYWSFVQDTTVLPDGWMVMHYVVTDQVNNRSYYRQDVIVMNNYPKINNLTLYTNNTGEGAVFTTHEGDEAFSEYAIPETPYAGGYLNSGFISKNKVIGFGVETSGGNAPLKYEARYVERFRVPLSNANLRSMAKRSAGNNTATDYLQYYNDANPSALITNEPISSFVNLYTIVAVSGSGLDANGWKILGMPPTATVSDGSHFVFQGVIGGGGDDDVTSKSFPNAYVYAYRARKTTEPVTRNSPNHHTIAPALLNFAGDDYFSTSDNAKINEANATSTINAVGYANGATDTVKNAAKAGTAYFLIKVWDTVNGNPPPTGSPALTEKDMLYDAVVVGMKVYLTDGANPFARLYDLNPYMEAAVVGNNIGTANQKLTLDGAADPTTSDDAANVLRGGLYNLGTERAPIKSGYIEPRDNSTALTPHVSRPSDPANPYLGSLPEDSYGYTKNSDDAVGTDSEGDKVSGSVILRGLAWDDQLIDEIRIKIGGDDQKVILKLTAQTDGSKRMVAPTGVTAWAYEEINWKTGHTVEWAYLWNTETEPGGRSRGGRAPAVQIDVSVKDLNGNSKAGLTSAQITTSAESPPTTFHNRVSVEIVPYVTGFRRDFPKFATKRSRQGWYSFFQGEENIRVLGYNLGTGITDDNSGTRIYLKSDSAAGEGASLYDAETRSYVANTNMPNDGHIFSIPAAAASGRLNVTVNGASAYNHSSVHTNRSWNTEYVSYTKGSDLWNNKPYAHIWRTNEAVGTTTVGGTYIGGGPSDTARLDNPAMALEYGTTGTDSTPGRLHGVWGVKSTFGVYYGTNNGNITGTTRGRNRLQDANDPLLLPDIDYFPGSTNANNRTAIAVYEWDGLPGMILSTTMEERAVYTGGDIIRPSIFVTTRSTAVSSSDRWQNPRVRMTQANINTNTGSGMAENAARGHAGRLYVSTYDSVNKSLHFVARVAAANTPNTTESNTPTGLVIDGGTATGGTGSRVARAGNWSAVDYTGTGDGIRPVIAYYDETNRTLRIAFGSTINSGAQGDWTRRDVLPSTHKLYRGSGQYVSMRVDRYGFIHLAFFNSNENAMVYAVGDTPGINTSTVFTAYTVDNVVTGGTWTDISVDNTGSTSTPGNPWIVYGDTGRTGNYDAVRVAYKDSAFTRSWEDPVTGATVTGWEALTMPANYTVANDRLNIESWPPAGRTGDGLTFAAASPNGGWHAAVGYAGTNRDTDTKMFRIGYFIKPPTAVVTGANWQLPAK